MTDKSQISVPSNSLSFWNEEISHLTGPLTYTLINDFAFKYCFQMNPFALKGLLSALLSIDASDILNIDILNPIEPGDVIEDKTIILDLKIKLNSNQIVSIEMQVAFTSYLPERFLTYLCRTFDHLASGENYTDILPCIQVIIIDSDLFKIDDSRYTGAFYSEYFLTEKSTQKEYSDKFNLRVLSLNHIEDATDKDNPNGLYRWARLFKSTTWEDIKMVAKDNDYMKSMAFHMHVLTEDEKLKMACEQRERDAWDKSFAYASGAKDGKAEAEQELKPIIEKQAAEITALKKLLTQN